MADDNELQAKLAEAIAAEMHRGCEFLDDRRPERERTYHFPDAHIARAHPFAAAVLPLVVAFGNARYGEGDEAGYARGRTDAAEAIEDDANIAGDWKAALKAARAASRGEG